MNDENLRCVIYSRVSTRDQVLDNQIRLLTEYAASRHWSLTEIITDVASGAKSDRDGLKRLFSLASQHAFDVVVFWSLDRFSREGARKTLLYLTRLDDYGVKWQSLTEEYVSSLGIFADAVISIMATLAKQERVRISERTKAGLARAKAQGRNPGRPVTVDARRIAELRGRGLSMAQIAKECKVSKTRVFQVLKSSAF